MMATPEFHPEASPLHYTPAETALLLLDFQQFIVDLCGSSGQTALIQAIKLRTWALANGVKVLHSVIDAYATPASTCKSAIRVEGMLDAVRTQQDGQGVQIPAKLTPDPESESEHLVLKHPGVVSGLKAPQAMAVLAQHNIKSVIVAGLSTSGAVLSTVLPATDDGLIISVVRQACADPRQGLHDVLMEKIFPSRAWVVDVEDVLDWWKE